MTEYLVFRGFLYVYVLVSSYASLIFICALNYEFIGMLKCHKVIFAEQLLSETEYVNS